MKKLSYISRTFLALFLSVAVINVYVTDLYCNVFKETLSRRCSGLAESNQSQLNAATFKKTTAKKEQEAAHHHNHNKQAGLKPDHQHAEAPIHHEAPKPKSHKHDHSNHATANKNAYLNKEAKSNNCHTKQRVQKEITADNAHDSKSHCDSPNKPNTKDDNCCNDDSAAFFSSLTNPTVHFPVIKSPVIFIFFHSISLTEVFSNQRLAYFSNYLVFKPPPKIPDIRVFVQSFII